MSTVLVTGAGGMIGAPALAELCARGARVHAVARRAGAPVDGVEWHQADLLDAAARRQLIERLRPEVLLHLAWVTDPGTYWQAPANIDWLGASLDLALVFTAAGGRRFVGAGTCAEYDWNAVDEACREDRTPRRPATLYGAAKNALFETLSAFAGPAGLQLAWGRVFFAYGAGEAEGRLVPSLVRALLEGRPAESTAGTQRRDFLDLRDVGAGFAALALASTEGGVNIGSGEAVAVADVVTRLGALVGRPDLVRLGALPMRPHDPPLLVADTSRLGDEVGFVPRVSLERGLEDAVDWWRRRTS